MLHVVKHGQQDQPGGATDSTNYSHVRQPFVCFLLIWIQLADVPEPSFRQKSKFEKDCCDSGTGDEQGLKASGGDIGDISELPNVSFGA